MNGHTELLLMGYGVWVAAGLVALVVVRNKLERYVPASLRKRMVH